MTQMQTNAEHGSVPLESKLRQFESRLADRTRVPAENLKEYMGWRPDKVKAEARHVTGILKRFAAVVVKSIDEPQSVNQFLVELDLKSISRDHDWRAIFSTLRGQNPTTASNYGRAAMIKYLQYLSFRKQLLEYIYTRRAGLEETDELSVDLTHTPAYEGSFGEDQVQLSAVREYDSVSLDRVPLGESIECQLETDEVLSIGLARHPFELVAASQPYLMDGNGVTYFIQKGRNVVGRHPESDIKIDPNFSSVSRAHMVLEWDGSRRFQIMDLSTRGTLLPRTMLEIAQARFEDMESARITQ